MAVIEFEKYKRQKKLQTSAVKRIGAVRSELTFKEECAFELCMYISDERNSMHPNPDEISALWSELAALKLPRDHVYYYVEAFRAFYAGADNLFYENFNKFLEIQHKKYDENRDCNWWIDCFMWVFTPALPGMYGTVAGQLNTYWPTHPLVLVMDALDLSVESNRNLELELDILMNAVALDSECYLAHYLIAMIYMSMDQWKNALQYFKRASESYIYFSDCIFNFDYAYAASMVGELELALSRYKACLDLDPSFPFANNNLGCVYAKLGNFDEASTCFARAAMIGLDGTFPHLNTVLLLKRSGRAGTAEQYIAQQQKNGRQFSRYRMDRLSSLPPQDYVEARPYDGAQLSDYSAILQKQADISQVLSNRSMFGDGLQIYEDESLSGMLYYMHGVGSVDLFCTDKNNDFIVFLFAKEASISDLLKLYSQIEAVRKNIARGGNTRGVLVCDSCPDTIDYAIPRAENVRIFIRRPSYEEKE